MGDLVSTAKAPPTEGPSSYQEHPMFMRFERQPQARSNTPHQPSPDGLANATGTPFTRPATTSTGRSTSHENHDFREQADGAP
jgi:hypothetical protein